MTDVNGTWTAYGVQSGLPSGGPQSLGPFLVPFSACQNITNFTFPEAGEQTFDIPGGADDIYGQPVPNGVWIIPYNGSGTTLTLILSEAEGSPAINLSPIYPSFIAFDPNNIPALFILGAGAPMTVALQYV